MERHVHSFYKGLEALTHFQGACGSHKKRRHPRVFSSYWTYIHTESPPFLYETFEKRPLLPNLCVRLRFQSRNTYRVFLRLKSSPSLTLNKIEHFSKVSLLHPLVHDGTHSKSSDRAAQGRTAHVDALPFYKDREGFRREDFFE